LPAAGSGFALALPALAALLLLAAAPAPGAGAKGETTIGVDPYASGSSATDLGELESCARINVGDTVEADVFVESVQDLLAWEAYLAYDSDIVHIVDRDVQMFQAASSGSSVFDSSEDVPDDDGLLRLGAADIADPPSPDSGSGVLARITLEGVGKGVSPLSLAPTDVDGDGTPDVGPSIKDADNAAVQDTDEDGYFDGPFKDAEMAVGVPCPADSNPAVDARGSGHNSDGEFPLWIVIAGVAAAVALAGIGGGVILMRRRRPSQPGVAP
jgi:hypothetical protein